MAFVRTCMMTKIKLYRLIQWYYILIGDLGVFIKDGNQCRILRFICDILIYANIMINGYIVIFEVIVLLDGHTPFSEHSLLMFNFNSWTLLALILHLSFRKRFQQRVINETRKIDEQLSLLIIHENYKKAPCLKRVIFWVVISVLTSIVLPLAMYIFPTVNSKSISAAVMISWILSNFAQSVVFMSSYISVVLTKWRFKVLNRGLEDSFFPGKNTNSTEKDGREIVCKFAICHQNIVLVAKEINHCFAVQVNRRK